MGATSPNPATFASSTPAPARHKNRTIALLVIVVAAIVVLTLVFSGVLVIFPKGSQTTTELQPFSVAVSSADNLSAATSGGPWSLHAVQGSDVTIQSGIQVGSDCDYSSGSGYDSIKPYAGNYSDGELANWLFIYLNAEGTQFLVVADEGGHASDIGIASESSCAVAATSPAVNPSIIVDSPAVAEALGQNLLVERFLASDPIANSSFLLIDQGGATGWVWEVGYQTCQVGNYGPWTGNDVQATVNATSGEVETVRSATGSTSCTGHSAMTPVGSVFGLFTPVEQACQAGDTFAANGCRGGDFCYAIQVDFDQSAAPLGDLLLEVETSRGAVVNLPEGVGGFAILNGSSDLIAESTPSSVLSMTGWTFPVGSPATNSTVLENGLSTVLVDLGPSSPYGLGYLLLVNGAGPLSGTFSENLP